MLKTILDLVDAGIIAIDCNGYITHFNPAASRILNISADLVIGKLSAEVIPNSRLHIVLDTGVPEMNQEQVISEGVRISTSRVPLFDLDGERTGVVCVFEDISKLAALRDQNTALKEIQSLLEAIINASQDAISVVDPNGYHYIINPAYTRLTGLSPNDVLGKPAYEDIAEGESVHMEVLNTRVPIRGAHLKVGPQKKDVVVNVAPVTVDGNLKGSVAVIHDVSELKKLAEELTRAKQIIRVLEAKYSFKDIIGESEPMINAIKSAEKAARLPVTVLLSGESGTGKELFASAIHNASDRKGCQFIRINCAAIVDSLFESELFGYEEGSFTGAKHGGKKGLFQEANGGTIFFDEVGELTINTQAKLLRVLQEKEIVRVGGAKSIPVNVRIIAATHDDLWKAADEGRFRRDLYYRLNVMPIVIPPLRQRKGDIPILAHHIVQKLNQDFGRNIVEIDEKAIDLLEKHKWNGNVRELENVLAQCIIRMQFTESTIMAKHLPVLESNWSSLKEQSEIGDAHVFTETGASPALRAALAEAEKKHILKILSLTKGNKTESARRMGISIRNLYNKLEKHGIGGPSPD